MLLKVIQILFKVLWAYCAHFCALLMCLLSYLWCLTTTARILTIIFGFLSESNSAQRLRVGVLNSDVERQTIFSEGIEP